MSVTGPKQATFCYRCGRRVSKTMDNCWYCGAPTSRWIHQPKRCPFCGEDVRAEAVKCRHCGEFIDGRPRPAETPPAQQIIFVVDRSVMAGMQEARLLAGRPVPPDVARMLDAQTVRAIETGQPKLISQAGVRALPAPAAAADPTVIDVEPANPSSTSLVKSGGLPARSGGLPARATDPNLPAPRPPATPARVAGGLALSTGKALIKGGAWLARKAFTSPPPPDDTRDAQVRDLYRVCLRCQTEILTQDNFCYHCGMQYHDPTPDIRALAVARGGGLRTGLFLVAIVLIAVCAVLKMQLLEVPYATLAAPAAGGLALLAGLYGVVRGPGFLNRFLALALAAIAGAALFLWR